MKIICIVQARMSSERLPQKVMLKVLDEPMITYTLDRLAKSKYLDEVVLATSNSEAEEPMVKFLEGHHYKVFRGSENNVLERYMEAVNKFSGDIIVRVTGDCPCIDPAFLDSVITYYLASDYDYVGVDTVHKNLIRGFDVEVFSRKCLERTYDTVKKITGNSSYKEHVTSYMYTHPEEYSTFILKGSHLFRKNYRLCVDTKEDFEVISRIYEHFQDKYVSGREIIKYLDDTPEVAAINSEIKQKNI